MWYAPVEKALLPVSARLEWRIDLRSIPVRDRKADRGRDSAEIGFCKRDGRDGLNSEKSSCLDP
jgi:hypothetical protein